MSTPQVAAPDAFIAAAESLRGAQLREELAVREIPAPDRVAPHAIALAAGVRQGGAPEPESVLDSPAGAGRFVLMHDPASADSWGSEFRVVCYAQAPLEAELGVDPFLADVAWSWLTDALESREARYTLASGTATKLISSSFGELQGRSDASHIELRASWTPLGTDFAAHAEAWSELLCLLAGLPLAEGVASIDHQRAVRKLGSHDA